MTEKIDVFTHSSIRVRSSFGSVYIDPFKMKEEPHDAVFILVTHDHFDHFSPEDIEKVGTKGTILIVPEGMKEKAEKETGSQYEIHTVTPGSSYNIGDLKFETVASYNKLKPFHPKHAGWVGYILQIDEQRIYIAGDTDATKEAKQVVCDVALVPVGGTYTMDAKQAAELVNEIRPKIAVPTHYGSVVGKQDDAQIFAKHVDSAISVEIRELY